MVMVVRKIVLLFLSLLKIELKSIVMIGMEILLILGVMDILV